MSDYFGGGAAGRQPGGGQTSAPPTSAPPNWYPDPYQPGGMRWFDGYQWTEHIAAPPPMVAPMPGAWPGPAGPDRSQEWLLPVNRTGLSIAAGYAGLFSILLVFAPIALVLGVLALIDLTNKPDVGGRGRAWFGVVAGTLGTLGLLVAIFH